MIDLDLDALERNLEHARAQDKAESSPTDHYLALWAAIYADALIQRLRETEAEIERMVNQRSLGDEQIIDEQDTAIKRLTTKTDLQQARIASLERVREAALEAVKTWEPTGSYRGTAGSHERLAAALAAVEEK